MSKFNLRMLRDLVALSGGELLSKVAGFLAFAYLARTLEPATYGAVEFAVALSVLFALFIDFGFGPVGAREIATNSANIKPYAARIPAARLILTCIAIPLMGGLAIVMGQPYETIQLVWLFSFALIAVPWNQRWLFQGVEMMSWVSIGQIIRMTAFALGVVIWVHGTDDLMIIGVIEIGAAAAMALYFIVVQQLKVTPVRLDFNFIELKRLKLEAFPVGLSRVMWALGLYLPTMLIALLVGGAEIAWFGAAHRIVLSIATFSMIYHFNLFPTVSRKLGESLHAFDGLIQPSFRVSSWGGIFVAFTVTLVAVPVCQFVYGESFSVAGAPLAILIWLFPVTLLSGHARWSLIASGHQHYLLLAQTIGLITTFLGGIILIPVYGAVGASSIMVFSSIVVWFVAHLYVSRLVNPLPFIGPTWRPLLVAAIIFGVIHEVGNSLWVDTIAAIAGFIILAPIVDSLLIRDIRKLANAKGSVKKK